MCGLTVSLSRKNALNGTTTTTFEVDDMVVEILRLGSISSTTQCIDLGASLSEIMM